MIRRDNTILVGPSRLVLVANEKWMRAHAGTGGQYRSVREPIYDGWGGLREPFEGGKKGNQAEPAPSAKAGGDTARLLKLGRKRWVGK